MVLIILNGILAWAVLEPLSIESIYRIAHDRHHHKG